MPISKITIITDFIEQLKIFLEYLINVKNKFHLIYDLITEYESLVSNKNDEFNEERKYLLENWMNKLIKTWDNITNQTEIAEINNLVNILSDDNNSNVIVNDYFHQSFSFLKLETIEDNVYLNINPYTVKNYLSENVLMKIDFLDTLLSSRLKFYFLEHRMALVSELNQQLFIDLETDWIKKVKETVVNAEKNMLMFIENQKNLINKLVDIKTHIFNKNEFLLINKYYTFTNEIVELYWKFIYQNREKALLFYEKKDEYEQAISNVEFKLDDTNKEKIITFMVEKITKFLEKEQCRLNLVNMVLNEYEENFLNVIIDSSEAENNLIAYQMIQELQWINKFIINSNILILKKFKLASYSDKIFDLSLFNKDEELENGFPIWNATISNLLQKWYQLSLNLISSDNFLLVLKTKIEKMDIINDEKLWYAWENNQDGSDFLLKSNKNSSWQYINTTNQPPLSINKILRKSFLEKIVETKLYMVDTNEKLFRTFFSFMNDIYNYKNEYNKNYAQSNSDITNKTETIKNLKVVTTKKIDNFKATINLITHYLKREVNIWYKKRLEFLNDSVIISEIDEEVIKAVTKKMHIINIFNDDFNKYKKFLETTEKNYINLYFNEKSFYQSFLDGVLLMKSQSDITWTFKNEFLNWNLQIEKKQWNSENSASNFKKWIKNENTLSINALINGAESKNQKNLIIYTSKKTNFYIKKWKEVLFSPNNVFFNNMKKNIILLEEKIEYLRRNLIGIGLYNIKTLPQGQKWNIVSSINGIKEIIEEILKSKQLLLDAATTFIIPQKMCYHEQIIFINELQHYLVHKVEDIFNNYVSVNIVTTMHSFDIILNEEENSEYALTFGKNLKEQLNNLCIQLKENWMEFYAEYLTIFNKVVFESASLKDNFPLLVKENWYNDFEVANDSYLAFIQQHKIENMDWKAKIFEEDICYINNDEENLSLTVNDIEKICGGEFDYDEENFFKILEEIREFNNNRSVFEYNHNLINDFSKNNHLTNSELSLQRSKSITKNYDVNNNAAIFLTGNTYLLVWIVMAFTIVTVLACSSSYLWKYLQNIFFVKDRPNFNNSEKSLSAHVNILEVELLLKQNEQHANQKSETKHDEKQILAKLDYETVGVRSKELDKLHCLVADDKKAPQLYM